MFDVGGPEFVILVILALLVFGPRRLPEISRTMGGFFGQMRGAVRDFRANLEREVAVDEVRRVANDARRVGNEARDAAEGLTRFDEPELGERDRGEPRRSERERSDGAEDPNAGDDDTRSDRTSSTE